LLLIPNIDRINVNEIKTLFLSHITIHFIVAEYHEQNQQAKEHLHKELLPMV